MQKINGLFVILSIFKNKFARELISKGTKLSRKQLHIIMYYTKYTYIILLILKEMENSASGFHQVFFDKENRNLFWNMVSPIGGGILN